MIISSHDPTASGILTETLARGAVAIVPCDTMYGLIGIAPDTERRLQEIKGRGRKPFIQLIGALDWLNRLTDQSLPPGLKALWPGPLTLVFSGLQTAETVAVRMPRDSFLLSVLIALNRPLYSTSVNRADQPALWRIEEIAEQFRAVDLIIDAGNMPYSRASTVLDIHEHPYRLLRQGEVEIPASLLDQI